jgi:hypothetical protein
MKTSPLEKDLSTYTINLTVDKCLPKGAPHEKLELMVHHAQVEAQEAGYRKIEIETGLTRADVTHHWVNDHGKTKCVFSRREESSQMPPSGISVQLG